jgi:hypothetical protein
MKDMTSDEARAEAARRWGTSGIIEFRPRRGARRGRLARYTCKVGNGAGGTMRSVEGQGDTWREAFADARPR